jgi:hypothetical protein
VAPATVAVVNEGTQRLTLAAQVARDDGDSATLFTIAITALANCDRVRAAYERLDKLATSAPPVPAQKAATVSLLSGDSLAPR